PLGRLCGLLREPRRAIRISLTRRLFARRAADGRREARGGRSGAEGPHHLACRRRVLPAAVRGPLSPLHRRPQGELCAHGARPYRRFRRTERMKQRPGSGHVSATEPQVEPASEQEQLLAAIAAIRAGDPDAFATIVRLYQRRLYGLALMVVRN